MQINVKQFLIDADITEAVYPGKRIIKQCKQVGEYKNHCVIVDWRDPETITIDIKPGLSGKHLAPEIVKKYPVSFQMPTHVVIKVTNDNSNEDEDEDEDEEDEGKSKGKSGGGGKKPARKKLEDIEVIAARFGDSAEGEIPTKGNIKEMVIMGVEIAKNAFGAAFAELTEQIHHAHLVMTEVLAKAADMVTRVQPPEFIEPKGDETALYNYDRDRNADIGFKMSLG